MRLVLFKLSRLNMADEIQLDPGVMALFLDSGDKGSFHGLSELDREGLNQDNESHLDPDCLEAEEDDPDTKEEVHWTDQLDDFQVPQFRTKYIFSFHWG